MPSTWRRHRRGAGGDPRRRRDLDQERRGCPWHSFGARGGGRADPRDAQRAIEDQAPTLKVETRTVEARTAAKGLRELAHAEASSLVVVGSSHRGRLSRIMLGSTADQLCRDSPCPVAIAPRDYRQRSAKELRVIGVAFDAGHDAHRALAVAIALAERVPAGLGCLGSWNRWDCMARPFRRLTSAPPNPGSTVRFSTRICSRSLSICRARSQDRR